MGQSSYPGALDSDVELQRVEDNITEIGGDAINSLRDAIFSIERAIGINPQGNTDDLVARIDQSLDSDGRIKTSALSERGLITLPISNAYVGDNAAIEETKLDLDYDTAALNASISSNALSLDSIRTSLEGVAANATGHFYGVSYRHDGYQIDLTATIRNSSDVESALNNLNNSLGAHEDLSYAAHNAYAISANDEFQNFSADNVQDALLALDNSRSGIVEKHQDLVHTNGVALNTRGEQGTQGNLAETVFASTIFQTDQTKATNILQVMRPNVARVSSKNIKLGDLEIGSQQYLRIQAGGFERSVLDVDLAPIIPTDDLDQVVSTINAAAQGGTEHYPISAYNVSGKLVIACNVPGQQFTIQILDDVQLSAATALGFNLLAQTTVEWSGDSHAGYVGGNRISDLKSLIKMHYNHTAGPSNIISLGIGYLALYGITTGDEGRLLCNITNHSTTPADNGTYYIIGYPTGEIFLLSEDISLGEFDIEIVADSVSFANSANGELFDVFVEYNSDGYGIATKFNRVSYGPIGGVNLKSISRDFATPSAEWQVSGTNSIILHQNDIGGVATSIPSGFEGQLRVYAPDNTNSALFDVTGVVSSARKSMSIIEFAGTDDRLHVCSVSYAGNLGLTVLKNVVDHRNMGNTVDNRSENELSMVQLENTTNELRNNGVIRGLDLLEQRTTSLRVNGGRALVSGRIVDVETQDVVVNDFSASKKLLLLNRYGDFVIKSEFDSGFSFSELTELDSYGDNQGFATIYEFETDGEIIDGYSVDRRLMVNKIDKRLVNVQASLEQKITQIRNTVGGSSWGFTIAESDGVVDGYVASIEMGSNNGFSYIPYSGETPNSARGFGAGNALITSRRFEFSDPQIIVTSVFRAIGLTHINVFAEVIYTGIENGINGPFGVSGTVNVDIGVGTEIGTDSFSLSDDYATAKTLYSGVLPVQSQIEQYVVSIPVSRLELPENVMFDVVPRIRIVNSNYVDGGVSADHEPTIRFDNIRIVTSSYSIAGSINGEDGTSASLSATIGDIL